MYQCIILVVVITIILYTVYCCTGHQTELKESFSIPTSEATLTLMINGNWTIYVDEKRIAGGGPTNQGVTKQTLTLRPYSKVRVVLDAAGIAGGMRGQIKVGDAIFVTNASNWKIKGQQINPGKTHYQPFSGGKYIGCFQDNSSRALPTYVGTVSGSTPIQKCHQAAIDRKAPYYALQAGNECFVGFTYSKYGYLPDQRCTTRCQGSPNQYCGGTWANQVYSTLESPNIQELDDQVLKRTGYPARNQDIDAASMWIIPRGQNWPGHWPQGKFEFFWVNTPPQKLPFCNYPRFNEFQPSGCKDPQNPFSCWSSQRPNYQADSSKCKRIYKPSPGLTSDNFFSTINRAYRKSIKGGDAQTEQFLDSMRDAYQAACQVILASGEKAPYEGLCLAEKKKHRKKLDHLCSQVPVTKRQAPESISPRLLHCSPGSLECQQLKTQCDREGFCYDDTKPKSPHCYKPPSTSDYEGENSARFYSALTKAQELSTHPKLKNGAEVSSFNEAVKHMIRQGRIAEFNPSDKLQCNCQFKFNDPKALRCYPC